MTYHDWINIIGIFVAFHVGAWSQRRSTRRRQQMEQDRIYPAEYQCEHRWCGFSVKGSQHNVENVQRAHVNWHIDTQVRLNKEAEIGKQESPLARWEKNLLRDQPLYEWKTPEKGTDEATGPSTTPGQSGS